MVSLISKFLEFIINKTSMRMIFICKVLSIAMLVIFTMGWQRGQAFFSDTETEEANTFNSGHYDKNNKPIMVTITIIPEKLGRTPAALNQSFFDDIYEKINKKTRR